jgi:hypothetical protein
MEFDAWDALDTGRDLIKHQVMRSQTLRHARAAIAALQTPLTVREALAGVADFIEGLGETDTIILSRDLTAKANELRALASTTSGGRGR